MMIKIDDDDDLIYFCLRSMRRKERKNGKILERCHIVLTSKKKIFGNEKTLQKKIL